VTIDDEMNDLKAATWRDPSVASCGHHIHACACDECLCEACERELRE
jgi:hypothetical protein